ncbi:hypothetical protein [Paraburkholderia tuberum]|nr:hypothetical protein [Paraburkholderia tuberum]
MTQTTRLGVGNPEYVGLGRFQTEQRLYIAVKIGADRRQLAFAR